MNWLQNSTTQPETPWIEEVVQGIRKHQITTENLWLVSTALSLTVELTGALEREKRLREEVAELRGRQ